MSSEKVLATGTFDILHPGHLYYLRKSSKLGDELVVIIARDEMIEHKNSPVVHEKQRRDMISGLKPVDKAVLGSEESIFEPLHDIQPDIITLGHDQRIDEDDLLDELRDRGFSSEVVRIDRKEPAQYEILSTRSIFKKAIRERG